MAMETEGLFAPASLEDARERYESLGPTAQVLVREVAKAMGLEPEEYERRVTPDVVETARDALFASLLEVQVGSREAYEEWCADRPDYDVVEIGSENVDQVVWHAVPFEEQVVAATYQDERRAAIATLRRQAFGRVYAGLL